MTLSKLEQKLRIRRNSISALASLLQDQKPVIERVRQDTRSIRESHGPQLSLTADADRQASSENHSSFNSSIGDEEFSFDDKIVNSLAYRNAYKRLAAKVKATQQNTKLHERHIPHEPLIDLEEPSQSRNGPKIKSNAVSNHPCWTPTMTSTHRDFPCQEAVEDLKLLRPTFTGSPSQCSTGLNRDGTKTYYTDQEDQHATGMEGELVRYPPDQARQSPLASKTCTSPRQSTLLPSRYHAQEDVSEDSTDEGPCISSQDMDLRCSRDYHFTIALPDKEIHKKAVALFDFVRESVDELSLKEGQMIWVCSHQTQGWLMAKDPRTGDSGFVPEKSVRLLPDIEASCSALSGEHSTSKERQTAVDLTSCIDESWINALANEKDIDRDLKEVMGLPVTDDTYRETHSPQELPEKRIQASAESSQRSSQSTSTTADPVDSIYEDGIVPIIVQRELCNSEITHSSVQLAKTETSSSPQEKKQRGTNSVVQQVARPSPHAVSPSATTPVSAIGSFGVTDGNVSRVDPGPVQGETQRSPATNRLGRRPEHEGQYDRTGKTKTSENEGVPSIVEYRDTNPRIDRKDGISTMEETSNAEKASLKRERNLHRQRVPAVEGTSHAILNAATLKRLENQTFAPKHDTESSITRQARRRRRVKDNSQDLGHDVPLLSSSTGERGGGAGPISLTGPDPKLLEAVGNKRRGSGDQYAFQSGTLTSSINTNSKLYEVVENALLRLFMSDLETLKQELKMRGGVLTTPALKRSDLTHDDARSSIDREKRRRSKGSHSRSAKDFTAAPPKAEDGSPVTVPTKQNEVSRDKSHESALIHPSDHPRYH